ncbi:MAG: polysaccharide deacetylase family protein [Caldilineaceae bacterium]|nr:polysaccharide deacetylase family protein [Caldilineaceae bacterium]
MLTMPLTLHAEENSNYVVVEGAGKTQPPVVHGIIHISGVADHPDFRKWQLDLLLDSQQETSLAVGEDPAPEVTRLAEVDTGRYPDGEHMLRLRIVHTDLNYDEYLSPVTFANNGRVATNTASATPLPQPTVASTPTGTATATATPSATATATATAPAPSASTANGIFVSDKPLQGSVEVFGVALHPQFRKWQVDLLIAGDQTRDTFIDFGEEQVLTRSKLTTLETTRYPNGTHVLRLRVVHSNMNYDEYIAQIVIDNPLVSSNGLPTSGSPVYNGGNTSSTAGVRPIYRGAGDEAVIYLTFDDGPHAPYTEQILALLARYNAKATFFVVGRAAQASPATIKAIYEAGHGVGNHSWSHRKLVGLSAKTFSDEMVSTSNAIGSYAASCMRPPYGATDASTYSYSTNLGYSVVLWSIDPVDWKRPGVNAIANHVLNRAFPGAIVVLHDGGGDRSQTVAATEIILRELSAQGYTFKAYCR